jgi:hypothetical protein
MKTGVCFSTHGGAGYASGSYWDGTAIVCGACGARIENPRPTGSKMIWVWDESIWGKLHLKGHWIDVPKFPEWILHK